MASESLQKYLIKPTAVGAAAAGLTYAFYGNEDMLKVANMDMSAITGIFVCVYVSDILGQIIAEELTKTNQLKGLVEFETGVARAGVTGVGLLLATRVLIGPQADMNAMGQILLLGALSEASGSYVYEMTNGLYTKG